MGLKLDAGHWRRVASEAMTGLPPLVAQPTAEATAVALDTLAELRERLGPHAPLVRELEAAIPD